ncbi:accelerated cell death 11-like [Quercus suber]|uniref:accelerated cell death 11-like n=1 Tax=Quercus suber TaxID=58331 RepID=UPI0032DF500D
MATRDNPVRKLADSLQVLADTVNSDNPHIKVSDLVQFCRNSCTAIFYLGITVKFPDLDPQTKVDHFLEASKKYDTIQDLVESEIKNCTAGDKGRPCRTLARFRRIIDLAREVLEQILTSGRVAAQSIEGNSQQSSFDFTLLRSANMAAHYLAKRSLSCNLFGSFDFGCCLPNFAFVVWGDSGS